MKDGIAFSLNLFGNQIDIRWYAIFVTGGMIAALILLCYLMKRKKDEYIIDDALEVFLFAIPFAIIFARLGYALPRIDEYSSFWDFWDITQGGLTIVVGVPGGALGILIYCLIRKKSPIRVFDTIVPCLLLGQVIGRWGNFANQELYGLEITNEAFQFFPFGVFIDADNAWHCANFFYESFLNFIALVVVLVVTFKFSKKLKVGTITVGYIVWYGILRGLLEFVKIGKMPVVEGSSIGLIQVICFVLAIIGIVVMILLQKGIIKFETEKMRRKHFITTSVDNEIMSNNNYYNIEKEVVVRDNVVDSEKDNKESEVDE